MEVGQLEQRLSKIRSDIKDHSPSPDDVRLVVVTKRFDAGVIQSLQSVDLNDFGENYAQELETKAAIVDDARWHFVGGLQKNKVKKIASFVAVWHSVSSSKLITEIASRTTEASIFIQVNLTGEPQKSGCQPSEIEALAIQATGAGLEVLGLMVMGPTGGADPAPVFSQAHNLTKEFGFSRLSMGMSGDYKLALGYGATDLRLGEAILGPRS